MFQRESAVYSTYFVYGEEHFLLACFRFSKDFLVLSMSTSSFGVLSILQDEPASFLYFKCLCYE